MELRPRCFSVLFLHVVSGIDHIKRNIRKRRPNICRCFPLALRNVFCKRIRICIIAIHWQAVSFSESLFTAISLNYIIASVGAIRILATDMVELRDLFQVIHRFDLSLERIADVFLVSSYAAVLQRDGRQTHRRPPSFLVVYSCSRICQLRFLHYFILCVQQSFLLHILRTSILLRCLSDQRTPEVHSPFPLLKMKGLHKAHCFQSKYNHRSRNSRIYGYFDYFSVNDKAGNLCSCPLIGTSTKVACFVTHIRRIMLLHSK